MAITKHVKHIRSSVADSIPTTEQLDYGEIAINYSADKERLFIKNANNEIVPFYSGKVIEENEQVTAAALTDLDSRINDIEENNVNTENMESVSYSELKSKRDNGELVPGKHYRITDYVTTTSQENTQSAGHQFDVVVLALDEKTLSENAHAMLHEGDTYFSTNNADLGSWELKYCLDNDKSRFAWAVSANRTIEPYDNAFRGCKLVECRQVGDELRLYKNYRNPSSGEENLTDEAEYFVYVGTLDYEGDTYYAWQKKDNGGFQSLILTKTLYQPGTITPNAEPSYVISSDYSDVSDGKGVIYYMKDEWNNECPYDFKNIQFKRYQLKNQNYLYASKALWDNDGDTYGNEVITNFHNIFAILYNNLGTSINDNTIPFYYTRGMHDEYYIVDESEIYGYNEIYETYRDNSGNTIALSESGTRKFVAVYNLLDDYYDIILEVNDTDGEWMYTFSRKNDINIPPIDNSLNGKIFNNKFTNFANSRILFDNVFISYNSNLFVQNNTFGNYFQNNTFGNYFQNNTFGNGCGLNTFGHHCSSNIFGNECYNNSFGNFCISNIFGNECYNNSFGDDFQYNTFGNYSHENSFGNGCASNSFRNDCSANTFGNSCSRNSFGNNCTSNTFGNSCSANTFGNNCTSNTFGNSCSRNSFGNNCTSNTFGNSCSANTFGNICSVNTFGDSCDSNTFGNDCNSNTFGNDCNSNTFGNSCDSNSFGNYVNYNTFGNNCWNVTFSKDYTRYVIVENGNQRITLTSTATPTYENPLRNITIAQGVNNTTINKEIWHNSVNDTIKTTYQPAGSVVVSK